MITKVFLQRPAGPLGRRLASTRLTSRPKVGYLRRFPRLHRSGPSTRQTTRRVILASAVALITAVGAITGARLKTDHDEAKQRQKPAEEQPLEERIAMLEDQRARLLGLKMPLERKLVGFRERLESEKKVGEATKGVEKNQ